jgi:hypothetical protein
MTQRHVQSGLPEPCPLCLERKKLSAEDIMPRWCRRLVLRLFPPKIGEAPPDRITLRICTECNGRLAALYENSASELVSPMIRRSDRRFSPRDQGIVGRWIIKTTLLLKIKDAILRGADYELERVLLVKMNEAGSPPDGSSVRVASYPAGEDPSADEPANLAELLPGGPPPHIRAFGIHTVGYLAFEVIVSDPADALRFIARTEESDQLVRIWPPSVEDIGYPPARILTQTDIVAIRQAVVSVTGGGFHQWTWGP